MASLGYDLYSTHPDEVLKDESEVKGISQRKSADSIGMGYSVLNKILNGRRSLNTTIALMFEAALGVPVESLTKLQLKHNIRTVRTNKTLVDKLKEIV